MEALLILMTVLIPIITGLTQLFKQYIPDKYHPLVPLVLGLAIGAAYFPLTIGYTFIELLWAGGLAGLSSGGFYDGVTKIKK